MFRTDRNRNPAAFTTDLAAQAGLIEGVDYVQGDPFTVGEKTFFTAKLLGDPVALTIRVIDRVSYFTKTLGTRWTYIAIPKFIWDAQTPEQKRDVIGFHYQREGGTEMQALFPNYARQ